MVGLAEAAAYGEQYKKWSYDSLPILPQEWQYTVAADKEKQFKILKALMHRADISEVVNACDAGREGELIFRFVYEMAGCKKPFTRLWISSMETGAIKCGFENLKDGRGYDALYHSALCRSKSFGGAMVFFSRVKEVQTAADASQAAFSSPASSAAQIFALAASAPESIRRTW